MKVLLDNNVTHRLAPLLIGHDVVHCRQMGWASLQNGELLSAAEQADFQVLITADTGMRYQQNMAGRKVCILLLRSHRITIRHLTPLVPEILRSLTEPSPGAFKVIESR